MDHTSSPLSLGLVGATLLGLFCLGHPSVCSAGDILRGGAPIGNPAARSTNSTQAINTAAAAARANAQDTLARTSRALQSARNLQNSARTAAQAQSSNNLGINPNQPGTILPNVPNGLNIGGLDRDTGPAAIWSGANLPQETLSAGASNVRIKQTKQTALLTWKTFNVGRQTTLQFDQSSGGADVKNWVAFNKINDPTGAPSQILGSIRADGQVYVINRNGIIFGGSSQVNTASLVASSLPINDNLISSGLLNNADAQFLFSGLSIPKGAKGTPGFDPEPPPVLTGRYGDVTVQRGAQIIAPTDAAKSGGRVMLVGPNVRNYGSISTPDGQTILAAGLQVGIDAHSTADPSLRGLDVFVGAVAPTAGVAYAGEVTQGCLVQAVRGNITMAGKNIAQNGVLYSTTSVSYNGRIDLQASYDAVPNPGYNATNSGSGRPFLFTQSGSITYGPGSASMVLPESGSSETVIGTTLALQSQINSIGRTIHLDRGAMLQAPSGTINLNAGVYNFLGSVSRFVRTGGQVYLDQGSLIDVAGSVDAVLPVSRNILDVELRGSELSRAPLQRDGVLRGVPLKIDIRETGVYNGFSWIGTPLGDATGFAGLIQRDISEFTAKGGTVNISAGSSVVMQPGSKIDVSGGIIEYEAGLIQTSRILANGSLFDIKNATPNRIYDQVYEGTVTTVSERWGVRRTFSQPLALTGEHWEDVSYAGAPGGRIDITAPAMALDGDMRGRTVNGQDQRSVPAALSSLHLSFTAEDPTYGNFPLYSPTPPNVSFRNAPLPRAAAFSLQPSGDPVALRQERRASVFLSPDLFTSDGFGALFLDNPDGDFTLPKGADLKIAPGGGLQVNARNISVGGTVIAPGGEVSLHAFNLSLDTLNAIAGSPAPTLPAFTPGRGQLSILSGAVIDVSGLLTDDRRIGAEMRVIAPAGGHVDLQGFTTRISPGSRIDVSGAAYLNPTGQISYGDGGSIVLAGGRDLTQHGVVGGSLSLGGTLIGYSGAIGGDLELLAPALQIGGSTTPSGVIRLAPDFFSTGGFASFDLKGIGIKRTSGETVAGIQIAAATTIRPVVTSLRVGSFSNNGQVGLRRIVLPEGVRAPAHLSFEALGASDPYLGIPLIIGNTVLGSDASIVTDAGGSVSLAGDTVTILGSVTAPGGEISVQGEDAFPSDVALSNPLTTVYIGPRARLSVSGTDLTYLDAEGLRAGTVFAGGKIAVAGNIIAEKGSLFKAAGSSGTLSLPESYLNPASSPGLGFSGAAYVDVPYATDGGTIELSGGEFLYTDGTFSAPAGGSSAIGGTLKVSSGRFHAPGTSFTSTDANLIVTQSGTTIPASSAQRGVGRPVLLSGGGNAPGYGNLAVSSFSQGGFSSLELGGNVSFSGDVTISLPGSIQLARGGTVYGNGQVSLSATYVSLGQAFETPTLASDQLIPYTKTDTSGLTTAYSPAPTWGTGRLAINASLIDVGNISFQGIGNTTLNASRGDVRGNGTLSMAGDLTIRAGQVYPTTAGHFDIFAHNYTNGMGAQQGSITVQHGSDRYLPWSVGGTLSLYASTIHQSGVLRAPLGTINLGWDGTGTAPIDPIAGSSAPTTVTTSLTLARGSTTSVSAIDPITGRGMTLPYGVSFDGESWIDPAGNDITVGGLPTKSIRLAGKSVISEVGSTIDVRGGGDLLAYQWLKGNGGPEDILNSSGAFAVLPSYGFNYAPYAPFNSRSSATNLLGEAGYVNSNLEVGDRVTLGSSSGLPAGSYTLLPARYALLPGGVLVTPLTSAPAGSRQLEDGSSIVNGYRYNSLIRGRSGRTSMERFEIAPGSVVRERAEYQELLANNFLRKAAESRGFEAPRLPVDAGYLSLGATDTMLITGRVRGESGRSGRGSLVDISSPSDILINSTGTTSTVGVLALQASLLNALNAESLLIGGSRSTTNGVSTVSVSTGQITVDNVGNAIRGTDIILAANRGVSVAAGSEISGIGSSALDDLTLGSNGVAGSGNGALLRVSGSSGASILRQGVTTSNVPFLTVGAGALISGGSVTLDSTNAMTLSSTAQVVGDDIFLNSGQISVQLASAGSLNATSGLVLSGQALSTLQGSARSLSLLSYSTVDIYGTGTIGSADLKELSIQANAIRGFNTSTNTVTLSANRVTLGNSPNRSITPLATNPLRGTLLIDANEVVLEDNAMRIERFSKVDLRASSRVIASGNGSLETYGALDITSPLMTGAGAAHGAFTTRGALRLLSASSPSIQPEAGGLGATLNLTGSSVEINSNISLPSGSLSIQATNGNVVIGSTSAARLDLAGTSRTFLDVTRSSNGGNATIRSDTGSVFL